MSYTAIFLNIYLALKALSSFHKVMQYFLFQVKAFNLNMQILNSYAVAFEAGTNMSTRILLILIELDYLSLPGRGISNVLLLNQYNFETYPITLSR